MMTLYVPRTRKARYVRYSDSNRPEVHIPVDVILEDDVFVLSAYVPGIAAEEIAIEILEDTVEISGEFAAVEDEDVKFLRRERPTGNFYRKLRLPSDLDASKAKAEVSNGVLSLRVPQAESAKTKKIEVKAK